MNDAYLNKTGLKFLIGTFLFGCRCWSPDQQHSGLRRLLVRRPTAARVMFKLYKAFHSNFTTIY
jgi:hypothetical protein